MHPMIKRSGILVLSAALLLPPAYAAAASQTLPLPTGISVKPLPVQTAQAKLSKEQALAIANRLVPSGLELTNTSFRSADPWRPFPEWSYNWVVKGKANETVDLSYSVGVNADTGEITSYSFYEQQPATPPYAARFSYGDAQKKAEQFLAQYVPAKAAETRLHARDMPVQKTPLGPVVFYHFHFVRVVDGVLFPENSADIVVNGSGQVTSYSLNWDDRISFEQPKNVISKDEAAALFQSKTTAGLSYFLPWERKGQNDLTPFLAYANPFDFYLDSETGKLLTLTLMPRDETQEPQRVSSKKLPPIHSGRALGQDDAVKLAQKLFGLSDYRLRGAHYNENDYRGSRSIWNLEFERKDPKQRPGFLFIALDAQNGDIYSFNMEKSYDQTKSSGSKKTSPDELKGKAMETIRKWTPGLADQLYLTDPQPNQPYDPDYPRYGFSFKRFLNGIATATGSAHISFDADSGELLSYNVDLGKETYPSQLPKHLSPKEAVSSWLKEAEVELIYALTPLKPEEAAKAKQGDAGIVAWREAKLVYRASVTPSEQPYVLDAISGEWRNQASGNPVTLHRSTPADIAGHPAEKELMLMYEYDAISPIDGKLMPQRPITRGEMIEMLMIALNNGRYFPDWPEGRKATFHDVTNGSRYFPAVEAAVDRGILDKAATTLKPEEAITREELADMLVRGLGYRKLAQHSDMFQSDLTDIGSSKARGAIVIVSSLNIMPTENQRFQPQTTVSRADAAVAFARFLEKRSDLEERRIYY
ncbi:YcdB/YcdC domain-containing protein [Brevibacillus sp. H7]|uniref:YcdB/YcdC domain-containing protein n=1 Tax=Brevibacillus sp. H7 TaxID=3349138 RepID=UPI0037F1A8C3